MLSPYPLLNLMEGISTEGLVNTHVVAEVVQESVLKSKFRTVLEYNALRVKTKLTGIFLTDCSRRT